MVKIDGSIKKNKLYYTIHIYIFNKQQKSDTVKMCSTEYNKLKQ